jgi:hypothetical protein
MWRGYRDHIWRVVVIVMTVAVVVGVHHYFVAKCQALVRRLGYKTVSASGGARYISWTQTSIFPVSVLCFLAACLTPDMTISRSSWSPIVIMSSGESSSLTLSLNLRRRPNLSWIRSTRSGNSMAGPTTM